MKLSVINLFYLFIETYIIILPYLIVIYNIELKTLKSNKIKVGCWYSYNKLVKFLRPIKCI